MPFGEKLIQVHGHIEELAASVSEITRQVSNSARLARQTAEQALETGVNAFLEKMRQ
jgi:methyl-accepting chemotaxis protein